MRVALITSAFAHCNNDYSVPPLINYVRSISDHVSVDVYAIDYPFQPRRYDLFGARVVAFGYGLSSRLSRLSARRRVAAAVAQAHRDQPYDLIHAVWANRPAEVAADLSARLNLPFIASFYAGEGVWLPQIGYGAMESPQRKRRLARVLERAATVTAGSSTLAETIGAEFNVPVAATPFGYAPDLFHPEGRREDLGPGRHVVTAASFGPVKGLDVLLAALRILADRTPRLLDDTTFHIIGPDPRDRGLREGLMQTAGSLPVVFHEARPHWDMPALYRAADLALVTSWFESQCFAAIEPAASGTPVMGTTVGILPDMASPDWLCPPGDSAALADTIASVLSAPDSWDTERQSQQSWLSVNVTPDHARNRFLRLYDAVVRRADTTSPERLA